ncbi:Zn-dependent protease with chaperone function [Xenococcus sp. PCC 7305]|uniref:M56 family metallopeptidase n=1 Tax=Xenococcus sp. PCC 7305 TaxID=102125 RepID=UPI0002ACF27F|nr:M56 family metallopeptidase [Xenococcus sp. PCC 7305]ELS01086.1 Zn-dependent protease with chaperone function [Xenococcus sp. PCC 7305]
MHLMMIAIALVLAWSIRLIPLNFQGTWGQRWQRSLFGFLVPPLILVTTALAIVFMGTEGSMLGFPAASGLSYGLAITFLLITLIYGNRLRDRALKTCRKIGKYPNQIIAGNSVKFLAIDLPYVAQIGFWEPQLVISQGLLDILDPEQLTAVLAHEQAHLQYRDTFWFFFLGWLRAVASWLPNTEELWQELLLLREIRADLKAAQTVDALVLAESLLLVAQAPGKSSFNFGATLYSSLNGDRLSQRIDALIGAAQLPNHNNLYCWSWLFPVFIPWLAIPFHS